MKAHPCMRTYESFFILIFQYMIDTFYILFYCFFVTLEYGLSVRNVRLIVLIYLWIFFAQVIEEHFFINSERLSVLLIKFVLDYLLSFECWYVPHNYVNCFAQAIFDSYLNVSAQRFYNLKSSLYTSCKR